MVLFSHTGAGPRPAAAEPGVSTCRSMGPWPGGQSAMTPASVALTLPVSWPPTRPVALPSWCAGANAAAPRRQAAGKWRLGDVRLGTWRLAGGHGRWQAGACDVAWVPGAAGWCQQAVQGGATHRLHDPAQEVRAAVVRPLAAGAAVRKHVPQAAVEDRP